MVSKGKILFVFQAPSPFITKDLEILKRHYEVTPVQFDGIGQGFTLLREIPKNDLVFCWFGKLHAFAAIAVSKLFRTKTVVVAGGDDVSARTQTGRPYGLFSCWWKAAMGRWLFKNADRIIAVSGFARDELLSNVNIDRGKLSLIHHGFDDDVFKLKHGVKEKIVVTIGTIWEEDYHRKGYKYFLECANLLPDYDFFLVGPKRDNILERANIPGNVKVLDKGLYGDKLIGLLSRASAYTQFSDWETFGCAVAEAMLCECVPVVTRYGALPEVVGECGLYVHSFDPEEIARKIREAAVRQDELGPKARQRILDKFPLEKRERGMIWEIEKLVNPARPEPISANAYTKADYAKVGCGGRCIIRESRGREFPSYHEVEFQRAGISPGMRVLDIGCGRGEFAIWCAIRGAYAVGMDHSKDAIMLANELVEHIDREDNSFKQRVSFVNSDLKRLPFEDQSFDRIVSSAVLEHIHDWEIQEMLKECRRLLKKEGLIYFETNPNLWYLKYVFPLVAFTKNHSPFRGKKTEKVKYVSAEHNHVNEQSVVSLRRNLKKAGFKGKVSILRRNYLKLGMFKERFGVLAWILYPAVLFMDCCFPFNLFFGLNIYVRARSKK